MKTLSLMKFISTESLDSFNNQDSRTDGQRPLQLRRLARLAGVGDVVPTNDDELFVDGQALGEQRIQGQNGGDARCRSHVTGGFESAVFGAADLGPRRGGVGGGNGLVYGHVNVAGVAVTTASPAQGGKEGDAVGDLGQLDGSRRGVGGRAGPTSAVDAHGATVDAATGADHGDFKLMASSESRHYGILVYYHDASGCRNKAEARHEWCDSVVTVGQVVEAVVPTCSAGGSPVGSSSESDYGVCHASGSADDVVVGAGDDQRELLLGGRGN
jgi:hypothetical protein